MQAKFYLTVGTFLVCVSTWSHADTAVFAGVDSRYVSEGRDNLGDSAAWSTGLDWSQDAWAANVFVLRAFDFDYTEWSFGGTYSGVMSQIDYSLGYTYLVFESGHYDDHEVSLALSYPLAKAFSLGFDSVYSVEADGTFVELSVHYHWKNTMNHSV